MRDAGTGEIRYINLFCLIFYISVILEIKMIKTNEEWGKILEPLQYKILREKGTEPAFSWELLGNKKKGVYSCVACGNMLFSWGAKFDSGTGWPSFFQPISDSNLILVPSPGESLDGAEVLCANCEGHLGHMFLDGPKPTGRRYCMNGAVLKFEESVT